MQPGPFNTFIADMCNVEEKTVVVYARTLKEAGLLTTGARGVNSPHMLPLDAARLVVALLATYRPSECANLVKRYGAMPFRPENSTGELPAFFSEDHLTFEKALVRVLALDPDAEKWDRLNCPFVELVRNNKTARLRFPSAGTAIFRERGETSLADRREGRGIWREHSMATLELATKMWADRFRGVDVKGLPLDLAHSWNEDLRGAERAQRYVEIHDYIRQRDANWLKGAN